MLETSFGLLFFLKKPKSQKAGDRYVYLRITVDGKSIEISTKRLWSPTRWSQAAGRATGTKEDTRNLNSYLDALSAQVYQAKKKLLEHERTLSAVAIKNILTGKKEDRKTILGIFQHHNTQMEALLGKEFAAGTLQKYKTSLDHTRSFIQDRYGEDDKEIRDLDYEFIQEFSFWLKSVRKCNHNTTVKYLTNLKKIVLDCVKKGWLQKDPFMRFKMSKKETPKEHLSQKELNDIAAKILKVERISQVRDIFLFSCYTGLAYADTKNLKRSQIVIGIDGERWISTTRQKTDMPTRLPLLPKAVEIIDKYSGHPQCCADGTVLPVLSNQKMNAYLKEIADLCGISKTLTYHIARHTFATTVTLSNGVPLETVSKMLGHSSMKQTQHYAKILDIKVSSDMGELKRKLTKV